MSYRKGNCMEGVYCRDCLSSFSALKWFCSAYFEDDLKSSSCLKDVKGKYSPVSEKDNQGEYIMQDDEEFFAVSVKD